MVIFPTATGARGPDFLAQVNSAAFSGVVIATPTGQQQRQIYRFTNAREEQLLGAAFDGRYYVFSVTHSLNGWDDWTLHAYDTQEGKLTDLDAVRKVDGVPLPGPPQYPAVASGVAAWSSPRENGERLVLVRNLQTGQTTTLPATHVGGPVFFGDLLLYGESMAPGELTQLRAVDARTLQPTDIPAGLNDVRGPVNVVARGDRLVWSDQDYEALWTWRAGDAQPTVLANVGNLYVNEPAQAGDLVTWRGTAGIYVYDLRTGKAFKVTKDAAGVATTGDTITISERASASKDPRTPMNTVVLNATTLPPLTGCR
ncbi:MAG: hypothetical protein IPL37_09605 [Austwickia sp.]|nr:hypothetical protein [Austwickia sp.]